MYVFGGQATEGSNEDPLSTVGIFDFVNSTWSALSCSGVPPPPRKEHTAVVYDDHMYVFGGEGKSKVLNDLYSLNLKEGEQHEWKLIVAEDGPIPSARAAHSAVVIGNSMLIFGGYDAQSSFVQQWEGLRCNCEYDGEWGCMCDQKVNQVFDDLWEFSFESKTWKKEQRNGNWPCPRNNHIAFSHDQSMYILGGHKMTWPELYEGPFEDLWCWNMEKQVWNNISYKGDFPKGMFHGRAVFDGQTVFVFSDKSVGQKSIYRLNLEKPQWEKCSRTVGWDRKSNLARFQFFGMTVVLVDGKAYMHGDFEDANFAQKNLVIFPLNKF